VPEGTLAAVFRERRSSRGQEQRAAAAEIGVSLATYRGWEANRTTPDLRNIPAAIGFLGFDWRPAGVSLSDRLRRARTAAGLSIKELAALLGSDPSTVRGWEMGLHAPAAQTAATLEKWLSGSARQAPAVS
jgi:transcriptional regulator with XRE-family HTH domain